MGTLLCHMEWFTSSSINFDAEYLGFPNEITNEEMVHQIHDIMLDDHKVKIHKIVKMINISDEHVFNIMHPHLLWKNYRQDERHLYS